MLPIGTGRLLLLWSQHDPSTDLIVRFPWRRSSVKKSWIICRIRLRLSDRKRDSLAAIGAMHFGTYSENRVNFLKNNSDMRTRTLFASLKGASRRCQNSGVRTPAAMTIMPRFQPNGHGSLQANVRCRLLRWDPDAGALMGNATRHYFGASILPSTETTAIVLRRNAICLDERAAHTLIVSKAGSMRDHLDRIARRFK